MDGRLPGPRAARGDAMTNCPCGQPVRLSAVRISVNRKRGVAHAILHCNNGTPACGDSWTCAALKPYPKDEAEREYAKLKARWETYATATVTP